MKSVTDEDVSDFDSKFLIEQTVNDMIIVQLFIHEQMDKQIKQENEDNKGINVACRTEFPSLAENQKSENKPTIYKKKKRKKKKTKNIYGEIVEVEDVYVPTWMEDKKGGNLTDEELKIFAQFGFEEDLMDYQPQESNFKKIF